MSFVYSHVHQLVEPLRKNTPKNLVTNPFPDWNPGKLVFLFRPAHGTNNPINIGGSYQDEENQLFSRLGWPGMVCCETVETVGVESLFLGKNRDMKPGFWRVKWETISVMTDPWGFQTLMVPKIAGENETKLQVFCFLAPRIPKTFEMWTRFIVSLEICVGNSEFDLIRHPTFRHLIAVPSWFLIRERWFKAKWDVHSLKFNDQATNEGDKHIRTITWKSNHHFL